jgi:hypothetical protein
MLPPAENELLTRVGPATPMRRTMRRYWLPALLASEVGEPDGAACAGAAVGRGSPRLPRQRGPHRPRRGVLPTSQAAAAGGEPAGIAPSYYRLRAAEGVLPADADWRERLSLEETAAETH